MHSNDIDDKSNDDADDNEEEDHDDDNEEEDHDDDDDDDDDGDECSYYFDNSVGTKNIDYPDPHHHHQHHPLFDVCCVNVFMEVTSLPSSLCPQSPFTP